MGFKWGVGTRSIWEKMTSVRIGSIFLFSGSPASIGSGSGVEDYIGVGTTATSEQSASKDATRLRHTQRQRPRTLHAVTVKVVDRV